MIPKPQSACSHPQQRRQKERRGGRSPTAPQGPLVALPHRLCHPAFAQLPCASGQSPPRLPGWPLASPRDTSRGTATHNTQPCTPRGLLGGSPSVQEHWQERPCLAPAGGEGPRRTEVWPSGTSVGRGQRVHPQGSRREHTCEPPHPRTAPGAASRSSPRPGCGIISPAFHPTFQPRLGPRGTTRCTPPGPGHRAASQAPRPPPCPFCPSGWAAAPRALSGLPMLLLIPRGLSAPRRFWTCSCLWLSLWTPSAQN